MKWLRIAAPVIASAVYLAIQKRRASQQAKIPAPAAEAPVTLEQELNKRMEEFLEKDNFSIMIQPVVDFQINTVSSGEVLARLNHPERGVIFPEEFLPVVDAQGLYPRFDRYIFRKSCAWLSRALAEGEQFACLSCNFSRKTLSQETLTQDLIRIADQHGIAHHRLAIEITERERESDQQQLIANLQELKAAGFRIFLDDYGNGVTSVNDLMQYPLDVVKIDRSLLLKAKTEQGMEEFKALVTLAHQLGTEVVCEGIETEEQSRFAQASGCHYGQGFLFYRPMTVEQMFEMMEKSSILTEEV